MDADTAVQVFARAPVPGQVKTRLIPAIGAAAATRLHERMLRLTIEAACAAQIGPVTLWGTPSAADACLRDLGAEYCIALSDQRGRDLGERLHVALYEGLQKHPGAIVVGSDCPSLGAADLRQAAAALLGGADAVLGPARDGGYYLLGARRAAFELFEGVDWGSDAVLGQTRTRLTRLSWRWVELATKDDIDRPQDLRLLEGWTV